MRKVAIAMVTLGLMALTAAGAQAEFCYQLKPFVDILRVSILIDYGPGGSRHDTVTGNWFASSYSIPVVGANEITHGSTSVRRFGLHGTNNTASFGGNPSCILDGTPGGAWFLNCVGGTGATFRTSGTPLLPISCNGLASASPEASGPEAGQ